MLKKSNAFKFLIGTFAVLALGFALNVGAAMDFGSATLKVGSKGEYVKTLQTLVGATPVDGIFGNGTKAKVMAWQANNGLVADGVFGSKSKAKANEVGGGAGALCPNGMTLASNCMTAPGSSSGAGALCPNGMTIASNCTQAPSSTVNQGTNGYLADIASDSTNRVSTVYESEQDKVVAGFRATARLASQNVNRVRVDFRNTDTGGSSVNLSKYISSASLWYGSTKLATMSVADADRATSTDKYTFNFSGLTANIAKDQIGRFYVSVNVNGSLDSNDATNANWAVAFPDGGVQAVSPDGSTDTYNMSSGNVGSIDATTNTGFTFGKFSANGVKATVALSSSNPAAATIPVSSTAATNNVTLLKFTVKATNSDLTIKKIPVQVTSTTADAASIVNTIKVYNGANLLDSVDGSAIVDVNSSVCDSSDTTSVGTTGCYIFSNLSTPYNKITAGSTVEFTVVADLKKADGSNYSAGDSVTASVVNGDILLTANFSVNDMNGDQLTAGSTYRVGSAVGEMQTLRVNGVNTVLGSTSISHTEDQNGNITSVTYTIPVAVTAFGDTLYLGQTGQLASTATASNAFALVFENSSAPTSAVTSSMTNSITLSSSNASIESNGYRLDSGSTKNFTITVNLTDPAVYSSSYRVRLDEIRTFTEAGLVTGTNNDLLPQASFRTGFQLINS